MKPWQLVKTSILVALLAGCSGKAKVSPEFEKTQLRSVAVLPAQSDRDVAPDRLDYLTKTLAAELQNQALVVLDDRLVRAVCSSPECPEREKLFSKYLVDAVVTLKIDSFSRNNFLAGYYNMVDGSLKFQTREGGELVSAEYSESERGGLLFNSGQIFQGVISQVRNTEQEKIDALGSKFIKGLVAKVPLNMKNEVNTDAVGVSISKVQVRALNQSRYEVCAQATPQSLASLVIERRKSNLREESPGRFCGIYFLDPNILRTKAQVEVRSPYGNSDRQDLMIQRADTCDLQKSTVGAAAGSGRLSFSFPCKSEPNTRIVIYKGATRSGPFSKVAEVQSQNWNDSASQDGKAVYYALLKSAAGQTSAPVELKLSKDKAS